MKLAKDAYTFSKVKPFRIDSVYDLTIFVHIVETKSLSAAARSLNKSVAFISKHLQKLEGSLDTRLFNRTTRNLVPTQEGEILYQQSKIILREVQRAESMMAVSKDVVSGMLTLTASTSMARFHLTPLITRFLEAHPDVKVRLIATDDVVDIIQDGVDLAIRQAEPTDSSLISRMIGRDFRVVCAAPSYIQMHGMPSKPEDLFEHRCILSGNPPIGEWLFERGSAKKLIEVNWAAVMTTADASHAAALEGAGIVYKSLWYVWQDIAAGRLVRLLSEWEAAPRRIYAIYPSNRYQTPLMKTFVNFMVGEMKKREEMIREQAFNKTR